MVLVAVDGRRGRRRGARLECSSYEKLITSSDMRRLFALRSTFSRPVTEPPSSPINSAFGGVFPGSLQLRHVDVGSCNGCEIEINSAFAPHYDAAQFGVRLVSSPRHSDGLLVTGVVTRNMADPLLHTLQATPEPRVVIACGDCAINGGVFSDAYGVEAPLDDIIRVDIQVPGCPPDPRVIVEALRGLTGR